MNELMCAPATLSDRRNSPPREKGNLWAIVLAGGEGVRLRALTRRLYGDDRPKQYAALVGARSLLRQTLDRIGVLIPPERTVVVTLASHARYVDAELRGAPRPHVLAQPYDRGTAAGVLLPAHWIRVRDADATVVVFPSDHFVLEESAFMCHVADVARSARQRPEPIIVLGALATEPEPRVWLDPARPDRGMDRPGPPAADPPLSREAATRGGGHPVSVRLCLEHVRARRESIRAGRSGA
jgi:CTP:molybdopterin cytidylyltransferase MocA